MLINMPRDARMREMLYQHDLGVARIRQSRVLLLGSAGSHFLLRQPCRVLNGLLNVLAFEVGISLEHLLPCRFLGNLSDDHRLRLLLIPRMLARPPMMFGSNVILSNMASFLHARSRPGRTAPWRTTSANTSRTWSSRTHPPVAGQQGEAQLATQDAAAARSVG